MNFNLSNYRILVTGASGMIGLSLTKHLLRSRAQVIAVISSGSRNHFLNCIEKNERLSVLEGDISQSAVIDQAIDQMNQNDSLQNIVVHLAAVADAGQCDRNRDQATNINVNVTKSIFKRCAAIQCQKFIFPSTAYVYGTNSEVALSEESSLNPESVYPETKILAEQAIEEISKDLGIQAEILRISNVYGADSKPNTIIGTMIDQFLKNKSVMLRNLSSIRDFIFIDDVTETMIRLILNENKSDVRIINVGTARGVSIKELAEIFCQINDVGEESIQCRDNTMRSSSLILNIDRLKTILNWRPSVSLEDGLKRSLKQSEQAHV